MKAISLGVIMLFTPQYLLANQCDCTQTIGACNGRIEVKPTKSSSGLYGADLTFTADASQCAKIDYWLDSTPAMTILSNGRYAEDSVVGISKKPLTLNNVTYKSCLVCKTQAQIDQEQAKKQADEEAEQQSVAQKQAEIEQMVNEAVSRGSLEPATYGGTTEADSSIDQILKLQSTLQDISNQQQIIRENREIERSRQQAEVQQQQEMAQLLQAQQRLAQQQAQALAVQQVQKQNQQTQYAQQQNTTYQQSSPPQSAPPIVMVAPPSQTPTATVATKEVIQGHVLRAGYGANGQGFSADVLNTGNVKISCTFNVYYQYPHNGGLEWDQTAVSTGMIPVGDTATAKFEALNIKIDSYKKTCSKWPFS